MTKAKAKTLARNKYLWEFSAAVEVKYEYVEDFLIRAFEGVKDNEKKFKKVHPEFVNMLISYKDIVDNSRQLVKELLKGLKQQEVVEVFGPVLLPKKMDTKHFEDVALVFQDESDWWWGLLSDEEAARLLDTMYQYFATPLKAEYEEYLEEKEKIEAQERERITSATKLHLEHDLRSAARTLAKYGFTVNGDLAPDDRHYEVVREGEEEGKTAYQKSLKPEPAAKKKQVRKTPEKSPAA